MRPYVSSTLVMLLLFVGLTCQPSRVWGQSGAVSRAQERALRQVEKSLTVCGDGGGTFAWYVLVFFDRAQRLSSQLTKSTSRYDVYTLKGELLGVNRALLVQGRRPAAEAVLRYLVSANSAVEKMPALRSPNSLVLAKDWDFRVFLDEAQARAAYALVTKSAEASR